MPTFHSPDGLELAYSVHGDGVPVVCLAGGPMVSADYLGDLGGLSSRLRLIVLDDRGTGASERPADVSTYRCDWLVGDVEALRQHLGVDQLNLLAHSAGANLGLLYAAAHPSRVARLALITPSVFAVGLEVPAEVRRDVIWLRADEPWFPTAMAAFEAIQEGVATDADWDAIAPFTYGRWDGPAQAHHANQAEQRNDEAEAVFGAEGAYDPIATEAALAALTAPVLLVAGEVDVAAPPEVVSELVGFFADAMLVVAAGAGHYPWLDDPAAFASILTLFFKDA